MVAKPTCRLHSCAARKWPNGRTAFEQLRASVAVNSKDCCQKLHRRWLSSSLATDAWRTRPHPRNAGVLSPAHQQQKRGISFAELDKTKGDRERIVILGSGWAGYPLSRELDPKKYQVVMVSPRSYFVFTPLLASTSVGTLEFRTALEPIRTRRSTTAYIQGWADNVDFADKSITIEDAIFDPRQSLAPVQSKYEGESESSVQDALEAKMNKGELFTLSYDKLIIGVGAYSQTFNTPGVKENANFLKDVGDSRKIRKRLLECFETAALPTVSERIRKQLLTFAVVGGGPTGMEFSAELHDFIREDLLKMYPKLGKLPSITVYDVADKVLPAFDEKLGKYATEMFKREGIAIKTGTKPKSLTKGLPGSLASPHSTRLGLSLSVEGQGGGEIIGCGMCVWSTGLMMNPFIAKALSAVRSFPASEVIYRAEKEDARRENWMISRDSKTGGILTNDRLRVILKAPEGSKGPLQDAYLKDVFALGDCALVEDTSYPATAQVASQKADWLAKRLNKGDLQRQRFIFNNLGIMAYLGNWRAIVQGGKGTGLGNMSGRTAWFVWRSTYLFKSLSWRNRILIPMYWFINWLFGRDTSRF